MGDSIDYLKDELMIEFNSHCSNTKFHKGFCAHFNEPHQGSFTHDKITYEAKITSDNKNLVSVELKQRPFWAERPVVARFSLTILPANLLISHDVEVNSKWQGRGIGQALHKLRLKCAKMAYFDQILAVVHNNNQVEQHILIKNGWSRISGSLKMDGRSIWIKYL